MGAIGNRWQPPTNYYQSPSPAPSQQPASPPPTVSMGGQSQLPATYNQSMVGQNAQAWTPPVWQNTQINSSNSEQSAAPDGFLSKYYKAENNPSVSQTNNQAQQSYVRPTYDQYVSQIKSGLQSVLGPSQQSQWQPNYVAPFSTQQIVNQGNGWQPYASPFSQQQSGQNSLQGGSPLMGGNGGNFNPTNFGINDLFSLLQQFGKPGSAQGMRTRGYSIHEDPNGYSGNI